MHATCALTHWSTFDFSSIKKKAIDFLDDNINYCFRTPPFFFFNIRSSTNHPILPQGFSHKEKRKL